MPEVTSPHVPTIEIIALLDDTVLSVTHLTPRRPGLSRATWAAFAAAGLALAMAAGAFAHAARIASANRVALADLVERGGSQLDFRPERISPVADTAGLVGLAGSLAFLIVGLWRAGRERKPTSYRVGRAAGVDAACDGVDDVVLISPRAEGWFFAPTAGMTGEVVVRGGTPSALAAGILAPGARVNARVGRAAFVIATVAAPEAAGAAGIHVDGRSLAFGGASAVAHACLVFLFFLIPASASGYASDDLDSQARMAVIHVKPSEDPRHEMSTEAGQAGAGSPQKPTGVPGSDKPARGEDKPKVRRTADEVRPSRPVDAAAARQAGILGVMRARSLANSALTDTTEFASGLDDEDIQGGYHGAYDDGRGGFDSFPGGNGPGGRKDGPVATGGYRTPGVPNGPGGPGGPGDPRLRDHRPKPTIDISCGEVTDGADRGVIRRYVREKKEQLTWCYQRELTVRPSLEGTATMSFTIDRGGRVLQVKAQGLGAPTVERCLEDVVRTIQFPAGGIVNVTSYPFVFHAAGG